MDALIVLIILLDLFVWLINNSFRSVKPILIFLLILKLKILLAKLPESSNHTIEMLILLFEHLNLISQLVQFSSEILLLFHPLLLVVNKKLDPLFPVIVLVYSWWHLKIIVLTIVLLGLLPVQEEWWRKASIVLDHDGWGTCFRVIIRRYVVGIKISVVSIGSFDI